MDYGNVKEREKVAKIDCPLCGNTFKDQHGLRERINNALNGDKQIIVCDVCRKRIAMEKHQFTRLGIKGEEITRNSPAWLVNYHYDNQLLAGWLEIPFEENSRSAF